jgi:medium-chain acyl-[acyl-carrier-protein] hydrolase
MITDKADIWFHRGNARTQVDFKLFCFPYAGGTASVYRNWGDLLPSTVEVIPVELPGRGNRLKEQPFVSLPELIDVLAGAILPLLDSPVAFFGHSMGAVIAFELARCLRRQHATEPQAIFVSGRHAPQIQDPDPVTYNLPRDEFIEELGKLDGTPKEVLEHAELMELMIPLLRADFQVIQTYEYRAEPPLRCRIIGYGGLQDPDVTRDLIQPWEEQTNSFFGLHMLPGDHFFIRSSQRLLLGLLSQDLNRIIFGPRVSGVRTGLMGIEVPRKFDSP